MMLYFKKYIKTFSWLLSWVGNIYHRDTIPHEKYSWKNYNVSLSIGHYITSHIAKFEAKIPLVSEEKKRNFSRG